ncbi:unnamed protein product [Dibothriocephalus latus]|uniref:Mitochondrial chaperone BCS1 n=1 Tax=Dibothriocephalus latus TaxID=60516 RepID=A0A3P7LL10_DIBLA|nr:unnamed protein product [Dibothriocephalus latus]
MEMITDVAANALKDNPYFSAARGASGSRFKRAAGQHLSVETNVVRTDAGRIRAAFNFIPSTGVHFIFHQGRVLRVERTRSQQTLQGASAAPFETVTLTTLGRDTSIFNTLLEEARSAAVMKDEGWTLIYKAFGSEWRQFGYPRPRRPLTSVVLDKGLAETISSDVKEFIESQAWYTERGIPYRRGYLLYGPPGCGKSSFITALAGHLEYSICVLNLSEVGMSADRLDHLLTHAPLQSIILLEDIDAALPSRAQSGEASKTCMLSLTDCAFPLSLPQLNVDSNVTRHLDARIPAVKEWDAMVLHFLGLDHIGHIEGPTGASIAPKLREMDEIVGKVYNHLVSSFILYVILFY